MLGPATTSFTCAWARLLSLGGGQHLEGAGSSNFMELFGVLLSTLGLSAAQLDGMLPQLAGLSVHFSSADGRLCCSAASPLGDVIVASRKVGPRSLLC